MAKPGNKSGAKQAAPVVEQETAPAEAAPLSAADRENPSKLSGDALRAFAHRRGLARSIMASMTDEKIRIELRYITTREYESDALA